MVKLKDGPSAICEPRTALATARGKELWDYQLSETFLTLEHPTDPTQ
jgi:hypothetical protein